MTTEEKRQQLEAISAEVAACEKCPLHQGRTHTVPGEGNPNSPLLFIGEAPGFHEDQQGRPFVGAAGQFLESLLRSIGVSRQQVFIANVVKCRPPDNRDPEAGEVSACNTYLDRQIAAIDPLVIVTLGRYSLNKFIPGQRISRIHGQPRRIGGRTVMPMYHPPPPSTAAPYAARSRPISPKSPLSSARHGRVRPSSRPSRSRP